jgi:histidinol-phosphate aminotransferase
MMARSAQVVSVPADRDFAFPGDDLSNRITPRTRFIAIANPNNPTGTVATHEEILRVIRAAPNAAVLVDEAYFEFYGQSTLSACNEFPNLFVARTFSKAYGLAGLRIGALVGDADQMRAVRRVSSPYNVNAVALACLPEALRDQEYIRSYMTEVCESRARLEHSLEARGVQLWRSRANFVLLRVGAAALFAERMRRRGILVRDLSSGHACEGCVRITLGPRAHCDRLLVALNESLEELGIGQGAAWR